MRFGSRGPRKFLRPRARSIQPNFPEISVQNSMDRFGPTGKVSKKRVHLLRWSSFPGRTGWNFGWMDRAPSLPYSRYLSRNATLLPPKRPYSWPCFFFLKEIPRQRVLSGRSVMIQFPNKQRWVNWISARSIVISKRFCQVSEPCTT